MSTLRLLVTKDCASHRFNHAYETLLVFLDRGDSNVRVTPSGLNWQPTDKELMGLVKELAYLSPTFAEELVHFAVSLNTWAAPKKKVVLTAESGFAEVLQF